MCVQPSTEGRGELVASPNGIGQEGDYSADHEFTINKPKYAKLMQVRFFPANIQGEIYGR